MMPKLHKVIRLDSVPLSQTYFTEEGYLRDRPVLTTTGIFEYENPDGTIRHELRLPEEVFAEESLASYQGKPIIITHDAGLVDKANVGQEQIGTILSKGYRSGPDVRAEIVIHDTDAMKKSGLKELSLGYNLDLDETPGVWNGQPYDAIQRNIRINHLALVREARAGDQARLNIDSRSKHQVLRGGKVMSRKSTRAKRRSDGILSPEELNQAIEQYKARRANRMAAKADEEEIPENPAAAPQEKVVSTVPQGMVPEKTDAECGKKDTDGTLGVEEKVEMVKDRRDRRDEMGEPENMKQAAGVIANQDEDIDSLLDIIDTLLAEREFTQSKTDAEGEEETPISAPVNAGMEDPIAEDKDVPENAVTDLEEDEEDLPPEEQEKMPVSKPLNADSIDAIVRQRVKIGMAGRALNIDGLENMSIRAAKKTVIRAVRPGIRLDGKSAAFINAMFECAVDEVNQRCRKDTAYQKRQMFNSDGRADVDSAATARARMIARQQRKKED